MLPNRIILSVNIYRSRFVSNRSYSYLWKENGPLVTDMRSCAEFAKMGNSDRNKFILAVIRFE